MKQNQSKTIKKKRRKDDIASRRIKNFEITLITEFFVVLFVLLIGYLAYFNICEAPDIIDNAYNKRIDALEQKVVRGQILAGDKTVLASTMTDEAGQESRLYPFGNVFCHVVGVNDHGKSGLESLCNYALLTTQDTMLEKLTNDLAGKKSQGNNVVTTLDVKVQNAAYEALGNNVGAAVVMEADTGRILAMVSKPDFDPNRSGEMYEEWTTYESRDSVLLNRATQGLYPPGSTFKVLTLLEFLREHHYDGAFYYDCTGSIQVPGGSVLRCFDETAHGEQNLRLAFANSCNAAFASIGHSLDVTRFRALCDSVLFNQVYAFELEHNTSSFVLDQNSGVSEIMETSIGQGKTQITPLHNLILAAAVANKGNAVQPYLVERVESASGEVLQSHTPESLGQIMSEQEAQLLTDYMRGVITDGTATQLAWAAYPVYGKTGSAQFDDSDAHHSWFMGFAEKDEKRIAVSVLVEGGREHYTPLPPWRGRFWTPAFLSKISRLRVRRQCKIESGDKKKCPEERKFSHC